MKIAIPVKDKTLESKVCISFGRTPYFLIYETKTKVSTFLDNSVAASQGGAGIKSAQAIADVGAVALITPRCGKNAAAVLKLVNIQLFKSINDSIQDNIDAFNNGTLVLLDDIHPGFHNHEGSKV